MSNNKLKLQLTLEMVKICKNRNKKKWVNSYLHYKPLENRIIYKMTKKC